MVKFTYKSSQRRTSLPCSSPMLLLGNERWNAKEKPAFETVLNSAILQFPKWSAGGASSEVMIDGAALNVRRPPNVLKASICWPRGSYRTRSVVPTLRESSLSQRSRLYELIACFGPNALWPRMLHYFFPFLSELLWISVCTFIQGLTSTGGATQYDRFVQTRLPQL